MSKEKKDKKPKIIASEPELDGVAIKEAEMERAREEKELAETGEIKTVHKKKRISKRTLWKWTLIHIGILMMSTSVYFFQTPNNFTLGGIAGIAIMLGNAIPVKFLTSGVIIVIINIVLLIIGFIILGKQCIIKTAYCSIMYTGLIWFFEFFFEKVVPLRLPFTSEPLLELIYGILLFGVGGALIFNCGSSSGGTDIIALILKKFTKLNIGMSLFLIDMVVVIISFFNFRDTSTFLFSLMGLFAKSFLLDGVIEGMAKTKYLTIITTKPKEIGDFILTVINHSYTVYDAEGGYTGQPKKVIITICKRNEALRIKSKIKEIDSESFMIIADANEILGKGFGGIM